MTTKRRSVFMLFLIAGIAILLICCNQQAENVVAFTHVNLVPMTGEFVVPDQTVLVEGSKIIVLGSSADVQIPAGSQEIHGKGSYLVPGLADMHMHTRADWEDSEIWPVHPLYLYLANGVTTVRDLAPDGSPLTYALQWRDEIRDGRRVGPMIYASGKLLFASPLDNPVGVVRRNHELGFDFLKLYSYLSGDDFRQAIAEAKTLGMYTTGHIPYAVGLRGVLAEGMDEIAHVEELLYEFIDFDRNQELPPNEWAASIAESAVQQFDLSSRTLWADFQKEKQALLAGIADQLQKEQVPVCTTMVIDDVIQLKLFNPEAFLARPENVYFEDGYLETYQRGEEKHQVQCQGVEEICAFKYEIDRWILKGLHDSGVLLLLGTDSGTGGMGIVPGFSVHDELKILVENGFTPYEALVTATANAAIVAGRMSGDGDFGTIEVGNRADLILVAGNPLEDLAALRKPLGVMAAGRWYSSKALDELIQISTPDFKRNE